MPGACSMTTVASWPSTEDTSDADAPRITIAVSLPPLRRRVSL